MEHLTETSYGGFDNSMHIIYRESICRQVCHFLQRPYETGVLLWVYSWFILCSLLGNKNESFDCYSLHSARQI